jgi:hypothetical protein
MTVRVPSNDLEAIELLKVKAPSFGYDFQFQNDPILFLSAQSGMTVIFNLDGSNPFDGNRVPDNTPRPLFANILRNHNLRFEVDPASAYLEHRQNAAAGDMMTGNGLIAFMMRASDGTIFPGLWSGQWPDRNVGYTRWQITSGDQIIAAKI